MSSWSPEEEAKLKIIAKRVKEDDDYTWDDGAKDMPGRTPRACVSYWHRIRKSGAEVRVDVPSYQDIFEAIRNKPKSLNDLSVQFDRGTDVIRKKLEEMDKLGWVVIETKKKFLVDTLGRPKVPAPDINIADLMGKHFCIGVGSDLHAGSRHSQPTFYNQFIKLAYDEYNVRHMFGPGDKFAGLYGYRGQMEDLIPVSRPLSRGTAWQQVDVQVELADSYTPKLKGLTYYELGGNHDEWHRKVTGRNGLRILCDRREDMVYCGYTVAGIPLTPKSHVRMWHPTGGVAYARSYRTQKGMEGLAFEALREAMRADHPPITSILMVGHLHLTGYTPEPPLYGMLAGAFEGQTGYLKAKSLVPHIAGIILEMRLDAKGRPYQVGYTPIENPIGEVKEDWRDWPVPMQDIDDPVDPVNIIFEGIAAPDED